MKLWWHISSIVLIAATSYFIGKASVKSPSTETPSNVPASVLSERSETAGNVAQGHLVAAPTAERTLAINEAVLE